jgi:hypothetical protein
VMIISPVCLMVILTMGFIKFNHFTLMACTHTLLSAVPAPD